MVAAFSTTITGMDEVQRRLSAVSNGLDQGDMIETALRSAALVAMNDAKRRAPYLTGNLRRSIHIGGFGDGLEQPTNGTDIGRPSQRHAVSVGSNVVYAGPQEFGGAGRAARPYLRPALDENHAEMEREFAEALSDLLRAKMR